MKKKIIYITMLVLLLIKPMEAYGNFVIEEEAEISAGEVAGTPEAPAPSEPPITIDNNTPVQVTPPSNNKKNTTPKTVENQVQEPQVPKQPAEQPKQSNTESPEKNVTESALPEPETEEIEITETEVTEMLVSEDSEEPLTIQETEEQQSEISDQEISTTEKEIENRDTKNNVVRFDFKKLLGIFCIGMAFLVYLYFMYGYVKIYNLSVDNKYSYIGQCKVTKSKGTIKIYISKFVLNRGKTREYKIVISDRILKSKNSKAMILILPGHEKMEVGIRKEIEFQCD